jgi:hypothetical protein
MSKIDSGPAFPVPGDQQDEGFNGMSLRDYFAAHAPDVPAFYPRREGEKIAQTFARWSFDYAAAMLAERAK